jgi:cobalamin biosynthesis protein CobD/CbiB
MKAEKTVNNLFGRDTAKPEDLGVALADIETLTRDKERLVSKI